jgi:hypothetical protein
MKSGIWILALPLCVWACSPDASLYDESLAERSAVVVRAQLLEQGLNCDKYCRHRYALMRIIKGASELDGKKEILIAALSSAQGPPTGECTLYLEPYSETISDRWRLVDDDPLKSWVC